MILKKNLIKSLQDEGYFQSWYYKYIKKSLYRSGRKFHPCCTPFAQQTVRLWK